MQIQKWTEVPSSPTILHQSQDRNPGLQVPDLDPPTCTYVVLALTTGGPGQLNRNGQAGPTQAAPQAEDTARTRRLRHVSTRRSVGSSAYAKVADVLGEFWEEGRVESTRKPNPPRQQLYRQNLCDVTVLETWGLRKVCSFQGKVWMADCVGFGQFQP